MHAPRWTRACYVFTALAALMGCSASVGSTDGGVPLDARPGADGAVTCPGPSGTPVPPGTRWNVDCNTCVCMASGLAACTTLGCRPDAGLPDAGERVCDTQADCGPSEICDGPAGCGARWTCREMACTRDVADYCGCDGVTFQSSGTCPMRRYSRRGACESAPDGGPPRYNCDARGVVCNALPPVCEGGFTASVSGGCWGPCVPVEACQPIPCGPGSECPGDYLCDRDTMECVLRMR